MFSNAPNSWIKIYRSIQTHWIWNNPLYLKWWLDLLIFAEWKTCKKNIFSKVVTVNRGELVASISFLQKRWIYKDGQGISHTPDKKTILKFLRLLEEEGMILKSFDLPHKTTLITIKNYNNYQSVNDNNSFEVDTSAKSIYLPANQKNSNGNQQRVDTKASTEDKNIRNIENINTHIINAGARGSNSQNCRPPSIHTFANAQSPTVAPSLTKEEWKLKLMRDDIFWEQAAKSFSCEIAWLKNILPKYHAENLACDFNNVDYIDYRRSFFNYARRENQNRLKYDNKNQPYKNNRGNSGGSSAPLGKHGLIER